MTAESVRRLKRQQEIDSDDPWDLGYDALLNNSEWRSLAYIHH